MFMSKFMFRGMLGHTGNYEVGLYFGLNANHNCRLAYSLYDTAFIEKKCRRTVGVSQ